MEKREIWTFVVATLIMSLLILFHEKYLNFLSAITISLLIMLFSIIPKKIASKVIDIRIEHKIWAFQRWWLGKNSHFKRPFPIGAILPVLLSLISNGFVTCFSFLQFDSEVLPGRAVKKYGTSRFSEIKEFDLATIVFYGILGNLFLFLISSIFLPGMSVINLNLLSKYSLFFVIWNVLPISQLDGAKLFFGSSRLYFFTLILVALCLMIFIF